jgi:hypothetical protein
VPAVHVRPGGCDPEDRTDGFQRLRSEDGSGALRPHPRSAEQFYVSHPVVAVVEAKKEDIPAGLGPCVAAMVAAQVYNEREGSPERHIYGTVTTGSNWRFLQLEGTTVFIDRPEYYLHQVGQVLAILVRLAAGEGMAPQALQPTGPA